MGELTQAEYRRAKRQGEIELATKPRAKTARYDRDLGLIMIELVNGATFSFPASLAQGLETASAEQLEEVKVLGAGFGLHWETLDADFSVEGLLAGRFGTARYMAERFGPGWDAEAAE